MADATPDTTPDCTYPVTCKEAGLEMMEGVLDVIWDREQVSPEVLNALTPEEILDLYDCFVAKMVDRVENFLLTRDDPDAI